MPKRNSALIFSSTDNVVEMFETDRIVDEAVEALAARKDCTIYHLLVIADTSVISQFIGGPKDDEAKMWGGGVIEHKFKKLSLKEQFEVINYVLTESDYDEEDTASALRWFLYWLEFPEITLCHHLLTLYDVDSTGSASKQERKALYEALRLLAQKEELIK